MLGLIRARVLPLGFLVLLVGCEPLVDADFPDIEVTRPNVPVLPDSASGPASLTFVFGFDSGKLGANNAGTNAGLQAQGQIAEVKLHRLDLTAKGGVTDWSFLRTLRALAFVPLKTSSTQLSKTATMRQVEIADFARSGNAALGATFSVPLPEPVDLLPLVRPSYSEQHVIDVVVNLGGQPPSASWTVDVVMSISVKLRQ